MFHFDTQTMREEVSPTISENGQIKIQNKPDKTLEDQMS